MCSGNTRRSGREHRLDRVLLRVPLLASLGACASSLRYKTRATDYSAADAYRRTAQLHDTGSRPNAFDSRTHDGNVEAVRDLRPRQEAWRPKVLNSRRSHHPCSRRPVMSGCVRGDAPGPSPPRARLEHACDCRRRGVRERSPGLVDLLLRIDRADDLALSQRDGRRLHAQRPDLSTVRRSCRPAARSL